MDRTRLDVAWGPMDPQPRSSVRMAFLALQCLENAMPYGGRIEISEHNEQWLLHGHADKINVEEDLWNVLTTKQPPKDLRPAQVQFALLPLIAADAGRRVESEFDAHTVKLRF
jgi:histidine phosphotransferase ChpT